MGEIPEDILLMAREFVAAEVSPEYRYGYMSGKWDIHGAIKASAKAIQAERTRCASVARSWGKTACKCGQVVEAAIADDIASSIESAHPTPSTEKERAAS